MFTKQAIFIVRRLNIIERILVKNNLILSKGVTSYAHLPPIIKEAIGRNYFRRDSTLAQIVQWMSSFPSPGTVPWEGEFPLAFNTTDVSDNEFWSEFPVDCKSHKPSDPNKSVTGGEAAPSLNVTQEPLHVQSGDRKAPSQLL